MLSDPWQITLKFINEDDHFVLITENNILYDSSYAPNS